MKQTSLRVAESARWERWVAIVTSLLAILLVLPNLGMMAIGLLEFVIFRKRHGFVARHSLQVALWQLFAFLLLGILFFLSSAWYSDRLWRIVLVDHPLHVRTAWVQTGPGEHLVLIFFGLVILANLIVMAWSIARAYRKQAFLAPFVGRITAPRIGAN